MTSYATVEALIQGKTNDLPVFCFFPEKARQAARRFAQSFPGEVLYAVKANPDARLLHWLVEGGVRGFDTASIAEIELVRTNLPETGCYYNHPIKPRRSIVQAYRQHGVRDFVVDHAGELEKLFDEVGTDLTVEVRVASDNAKARVNFSTKFGASAADAVALLRAAKARGARPALCMHVGYQTSDPMAYVAGMRLMTDVAQDAGVAIAYMNVGGGFPSVLMPAGLGLQDYFAAIGAAYAADTRLAAVPLKCEPGSALAHPSGAVLALVLSVNRDRVYLNDGVYGALAELPYTRIQPPTRVFTPAAAQRSGPLRQFTVFGPTCDSVDTLPVPFSMPADVREGDWLLLENTGAYSSATITDFNGLGRHEFAVIGQG